MCRLLGVVSRDSRPTAQLLGDDLTAFAALSRQNGDGWGIAYADLGELTVDRQAAPAHAGEAFAAAIDRATTDTAILHLREATGAPVALENTHPFVADGLAFAHNGDFAPADAIDELLDPELLGRHGGSTDSERFFALIRSHLRDSDPVTALAQAAADIRTRATVSGLNCLLLTPEAMYAYADHEPSSWLAALRGPNYFPLNYRVADDRVVVASTGWEQPDSEWHRLDDRQVLEIRRGDLRVSHHNFAADVNAGS